MAIRRLSRAALGRRSLAALGALASWRMSRSFKKRAFPPPPPASFQAPIWTPARPQTAQRYRRVPCPPAHAPAREIEHPCCYILRNTFAQSAPLLGTPGVPVRAPVGTLPCPADRVVSATGSGCSATWTLRGRPGLRFSRAAAGAVGVEAATAAGGSSAFCSGSPLSLAAASPQRFSKMPHGSTSTRAGSRLASMFFPR